MRIGKIIEAQNGKRTGGVEKNLAKSLKRKMGKEPAGREESGKIIKAQNESLSYFSHFALQ